jgi:HSP20 family protein
MLVRYDPFRQFDRMADQLFGGAPNRPQLMALDAVRREHEVELRFDLPGVSPDTIDLTVERDVLTVKAERQFEHEEGEEVLTQERSQGAVTRQIVLGELLDAERLHARYDSGVLTVVIPVAEQAKARKVEIHIGSASDAIEVGSPN